MRATPAQDDTPGCCLHIHFDMSCRCITGKDAKIAGVNASMMRLEAHTNIVRADLVCLAHSRAAKEHCAVAEHETILAGSEGNKVRWKGNGP